MAETVHAFDFVKTTTPPATGVCVLFGDEPCLRQLAREHVRGIMTHGDADTPVSQHDGSEKVPEWRDVIDELATASLFGGGGARLVELREADSFVSTHRQRLEDFVTKGKSHGVLVLEVSEWPGNTRLAKMAAESTATVVDCRPPQKVVGKNKVIDESAIARWLTDWARTAHSAQLPPDAAKLLLELTGPVFGVLVQDIAKLSLFVKAGEKITPEMVQDIVGGWKARSLWDLGDAVAGGEAGDALAQLDHVLQAGEHPLAITGSLGWGLRRYALATRIFREAERSGIKVQLRDALLQAGFKDWPLGTLAKAEARLKQLGRVRGGQLYRWLLELDLSLKGTHSNERRGRWAVERMFLRLAKQAAPKR
ncbi:DNA polymerase III subunit delta [Anatilimnocola aggregata]|uniref:DNA-directed DNA polymerase n=1 Tax=Anatilimnocola aggregata TaxID=2528021 RepID=A0A517YIU5_9BACT|nr:DNA polymerase III subunit delta [Anatilimnocola aggregata]QDU30146.1 DNA polymerase III subunit delta [Anatilimnocola aggregata]